MAKVLVSEKNLTSIADSIRAKNGTTTKYKPSEMGTAITNLGTKSKYKPQIISFRDYTGTNLDYEIKNLDTSKIKNMSGMFASCSILNSLDVSSFDTSKVIYMNNMFVSCGSLTTLNVSNWDVSSVTSMNGTFSYCGKLTTLNVSNWDVSSVTSMNGTFSYCGSLTTDSLHSIVKMLLTATKVPTKTLKYIGLFQTQATTCTTFSEWSTLTANGWTTGY